MNTTKYGLTSEMEETEVVCNHLLGALLRAQLDAAREEDVTFASGQSHSTSSGHHDVGHVDDTPERRRFAAKWHLEWTHGGSFQYGV